MLHNHTARALCDMIGKKLPVLTFGVTILVIFALSIAILVTVNKTTRSNDAIFNTISDIQHQLRGGAPLDASLDFAATTTAVPVADTCTLLDDKVMYTQRAAPTPTVTRSVSHAHVKSESA